MFTFVTKKQFGLLSLLFVITLIWFVDSTAKESVNQTEELMPFVELKSASDLTKDATEANTRQVPILLFFSMKHCPFCIEVEEDYLKPMLRNAEYNGKIIIRKIRIDGTDTMRDFKDAERDVDEFGEDYNVSMVPTVVLVDSHGNKISPAIIGIANSHYYSSELDNAIELSTQKIRSLAQR